MNNDAKSLYVRQVIQSCKTLEQLDVCETWLDNVTFKNTGDSIYEATIYKQDLQIACMSMRHYLNKVEAVQ